MKESAIAFLKLAAFGRTKEAFEKFVASEFRHHNAHFKGDADSLREAMQQNYQQFPQRTFDIQRVLQDGDLVAVHSRISFVGKVIAVVHMFRFRAGKIVELWDVGQELPADSPNENGAF
jgi:predicted SnoaL-like aldol condensation-catalyzing enzyme